MTSKIICVSPVDNRVYAERAATSLSEAREIFAKAKHAQKAWAALSVEDRCAVLGKAIDHFSAAKEEIAPEIAWQMGRPVSQCAGEINGLEERARHMLSIAPRALADDVLPQNGLVLRTIRREALGTSVASRDEHRRCAKS